MVESIVDIIDTNIKYIRLKMDLSAEQINTYRRRANSNIWYAMLAVIAGVSFQAGIVKPLCRVIHQEPIKSEVCENNFSQFGLLLVVGGMSAGLLGGIAKLSLEKEYLETTRGK